MILFSKLQIANLDSAIGTVERRIFELHLAVGDEQHVIYVKEEIDSLNRCREIQVVFLNELTYRLVISLEL